MLSFNSNVNDCIRSVEGVVVFIHNVPVQFVNQLKSKGLSRSHPGNVGTAAVVTHQQRKNYMYTEVLVSVRV